MDALHISFFSKYCEKDFYRLKIPCRLYSTHIFASAGETEIYIHALNPVELASSVRIDCDPKNKLLIGYKSNAATLNDQPDLIVSISGFGIIQNY